MVTFAALGFCVGSILYKTTTIGSSQVLTHFCHFCFICILLGHTHHHHVASLGSHGRPSYRQMSAMGIPALQFTNQTNSHTTTLCQVVHGNLPFSLLTTVCVYFIFLWGKHLHSFFLFFFWSSFKF